MISIYHRNKIRSKQKDRRKVEKEREVYKAQRDALEHAFGHNFAHICGRLKHISDNQLRPLEKREG